MSNNLVKGFKTEDKEEYWGHWIICGCGCESNVETANYCSGCGRRLMVVGTAKFDRNTLEYVLIEDE